MQRNKLPKFQLRSAHRNQVIAKRAKTIFRKLQDFVWVRHIGIPLWHTNMAAKKVQKGQQDEKHI